MTRRRSLARRLATTRATLAATIIGCIPLLVTPEVGFATELWSSGEASFSFGGSLRQIGLYTRQTDASDFANAIREDVTTKGPATTCVAAADFEDCPAFDEVGKKDVGQGFTRLRLEADLVVTHWLSARIVYDNELRFGVLDTLEAELGGNLESESFLDAESGLSEGAHHDWNHRLYRGFVRIETDRFELSVGRQRVAWGVGRLWTPIDRFSALPPLSLEPDITPGIDGIDARFNFDGFDYIQFVYAPGDHRRAERWAVRLHGVLLDADLSLMGGLFEEAPTVGFDFTHNLLEGAFGFEAVFTSPEHDVWPLGNPAPAELPAYWQVVVSYDRNLELGTGLYVLAEYLYNGNALGFGRGRAGPLLPLFESTDTPPFPTGIVGPYATSASPDVFGSSRIVTLSKHQIGLQFGYDLTPELRGDLVTLVDLEGGSAAFSPNLAYSLLDELEIRLTAQLFTGPKRSQYGSSKALVQLLMDWYF